MINNFKKGRWNKFDRLSTISFICWNCNNKVASEKGYYSYHPINNAVLSIISICPNCNSPNMQDDEKNNIISPLPGIEIKNLPEQIEKTYNETRKCMQTVCFNAAIMLMRKMIMHIAVEEGDSEGKSFVEYVNFLCDEGIVPKKSRSKAESIRNLGNSANHEVENRTEDDAKNCFEFIELLLKVNYEFADNLEESSQ